MPPWYASLTGATPQGTKLSFACSIALINPALPGCKPAAIPRIVVVRQHVQRKAGSVAGKTLSLFADDADLQGWHYGAMLTDLRIPALEVWRLYRGRADCVDLGFCQNRMSVFRHTVMRQSVHHTLHHKVLAVV
jgi:hypothetical protein